VTTFRVDWTPSLARWFGVMPWMMEEFTTTELRALVAESVRLEGEASRGD